MEKEICSLKELRGILGDDVVENMLPAPGDAIEYYWDRSETNPFDIDVLQDWIDDCLPDVLGRHESDGYYYQPENFNRDLPAAEVLPTSLAEYLEERMLASDWLADWRDATIREMADDAVGSLETALRSHPECDGMGLDEPSLRSEIAELIEERTFVALGLGGWLDEPACVTAYVGTRAELSADTSTVPRLIHAALSSASHEEFLERCSEGDEGSRWATDNGLAKLCESQGEGDLWQVLHDDEPGPFSRSMRNEVDEFSSSTGGIVVCAKTSIREWAVLEGAVALGHGLSARDAPVPTITVPVAPTSSIGLYDRMTGGGSLLGIELVRDIEVPVTEVLDFALEGGYPGRDFGREASRVSGYAVHDAFQCTDDLWVDGSIVPHVLDAVTIGNLTEAPREAECAAERRHGPRL